MTLSQKRIGVTGATGFIGRALVSRLAAEGASVVAFTRGDPSQRFHPAVRIVRYDPDDSRVTVDWEGLDAVVHLAGEPVDGRWNDPKKAAIYNSRVIGTRRLVERLSNCARPPKVLVCASAVGYYGDRGNEPLFELSSPGDDFLANVVVDWEAEAAKAAGHRIRAVSLRTGIVLGDGGALNKMLPTFKTGLGGPFGSGRQFVPWIHVDDLVSMYVTAIADANWSGAVNAVAPDYATSSRMAQAIGAALGRPAMLPAPKHALRLVLGEFATTLFSSQLVLPAFAQDHGFAWQFDNLERALASILSEDANTSLVHRLQFSQLVPGSPGKVFSFFSEPRNLEALTPDFLRFRITRAPAQVARGSIIDYRLHLRGVPVGWKTLISECVPLTRFVDVQLHGPYALWRHQHDFEAVDGGVRIRDTVDFALPLWPASNLLLPTIEGEIRKIFAHRERVIEKRLGWLYKPERTVAVAT